MPVEQIPETTVHMHNPDCNSDTLTCNVLAHEDLSVLAEEYERFSVFARSGNKVMVVAIRGDNTSWAVTLTDGKISTRSMLADKVAL